MTRPILASLLLSAGLVTVAPSALALDETGAAVLGAGAGVAVGHMIGGRDAAIVGGFLGALIGAAAADDDDHDRVVLRHPPRYRPDPYGVVVVRSPRPLPPPAWAPYHRRDRFDRRDRWDDDRGHWDRGRWDDDRGHRDRGRWDGPGW